MSIVATSLLITNIKYIDKELFFGIKIARQVVCGSGATRRGTCDPKIHDVPLTGCSVTMLLHDLLDLVELVEQRVLADDDVLAAR